MIVYTLGNEKVYDEALKRNPNLKKLGKSDTYEGGIIFLNIEEANKFIEGECHEDAEFWNFKAAIYEVEIESKKDIVLYNSKYNSFVLLKDSLIKGKIK